MSASEGKDLLSRWNRMFEDFRAKAEAPTVTPPAIDYAEAIRTRIERIPAFPVEQEVLRRIFEDNPQLDPHELRAIRKACDMNGPVLLEYQHPPYPNTTYLYVHADCHEPDHLGMMRLREPVDKASLAFEDGSVAVLLKLGISRKFTEVHRWKKETESEQKVGES